MTNISIYGIIIKKNKKFALFLALVILTVFCVPLSTAAQSYYDTGDETFYKTYGDGKASAYCWNDLTYNDSTRAIKSDGWITYKNNYSSEKGYFHNCINLNVFTASGRYGKVSYSNSSRNVVVNDTAPSNFTWCNAYHGVNKCADSHNHSAVQHSTSTNVELFVYIRVA